MNQKIKVNNGQELIAKAKEYKNSGGEWKLQELYMEMATGKKRKERLSWGIIISNGEKEINICSLGEKGFGKSGMYDHDEVCNQLHQLFPKAADFLFAGDDKEHDDYGGRPIKQRLDTGTFRKVKETEGEWSLYRYLVAEKFKHLEKMIGNYFRENEAKIYNSPNHEFSDWAEIIDGQDGNMYLYVGEKNENSGREIKIGITKEEFDKKEIERLKGSEMLETYWNLYIMTSNQPQTPTEKENYYKGLEKTFQEQWPHREKLCRKYWESVREEMEKCFNYWNEKSRQSQYLDHEANEKGILARALASQIKEELSENKNIKICSDECQHLWENNPSVPTLPQPSPKNNQLSTSEKSQILQYFLQNDITKIALENGKLVVEYNGKNKKVIENENSEQQKYHQIIQNLPNKYLSLSELQNNNNSSAPNENNTGTYIGLAIGAFILVGIFVYFLVHKKKK